jgi:hypothetical protein
MPRRKPTRQLFVWKGIASPVGGIVNLIEKGGSSDREAALVRSTPNPLEPRLLRPELSRRFRAQASLRPRPDSHGPAVIRES